MRSKSYVIDLFITLINYVKRQYSSTVKYVQSDGGGEYICSFLRLFFKVGGIHLIFCLGTSEQNGIAKRKHRHVDETSLTLLPHSKPLKEF